MTGNHFVAIVPAAARDAVNTMFAEALGQGPENFVTPLCVAGGTEATFYACGTSGLYDPEVAKAWLESPPAEYAALVAQMTFDWSDDETGHLDAVLEAQGLVRFVPEGAP